jgi:hypothetical protein
MRRHISYANVMATIAVFIALGGSAYAVKRIDGKDIAAHTIPASKLKKETLTRDEIGPRAIGRSELSRGLRAALRPPDEPGLPPQDGFDGLPGEPGEPGEPGPPGASCDTAGPRLCPDDELPVGSTLTLTIAGVAADVPVDPAYRAGCTVTPAACTVLVRGPLPVPAAIDAWYRAASTPGNVRLAVARSGAVVAEVTGPNGRPLSLIRHGDGFDLAIAVDEVREAAP